ncbi:MAG: beta-ketoacyl-[acyl-carrier-protein] synthase family protein [Saprospiraceae bacterium]|nr:beta-ketoacyl-[acyl-carrier-protein] synthase family protein [Saprospiraceae bacterium]
MKIYVTGIGVVSAVGLNVDENLNSLQSLQTGIKKSNDHQLLLGKVKWNNEQIIKLLNLPKEDYSRTSLLSLLAANEAWKNNRHFVRVRTGLISATSVGGLDKMEEYYIQSKKYNQSDSYTKQIFENGGTTEKVARELGISGYIGTISTACSSGANSIMLGARMVEGKKLDRVIVGGCDPLTLFNINGFNSLKIYDESICKPFDENRKGLNLGEGAAFLVIENEHSVSVTGNTPLCILSGWNNSTDAYHQTASSPNGQGAVLSMSKALIKAKITPEKINYINAHGTGTENNDLSESMAIKAVFEDNIPPFSSTKGFTGHTLAAAGAIEAVYSVLALNTQVIPPNLHYTTPMKETGMAPCSIFQNHANIEHVLSNSFGFGGNCTSLIFSKI